MENKKNNKILLVILWIYFWPIMLPVWLITEGSRRNQKYIGNSGEAYISRKLHELGDEHYTILDNLLLRSNGNTNTIQIDHVVISTYGIFCIETKNHKGAIYGSSHSKYWKQYIYSRPYEMYNPLWQNYAHVKSLEAKLFGRLHAPIESLVVFPRADKLKIYDTRRVGKTYQIINNIRSHQHLVYTDTERASIVWLVKNANITDNDIIAQHKTDVRELARL